MKVTVRESATGLSIYVPKKDLEAHVVKIEKAGVWGGVFELDNGWILEFEAMDEKPELPKTMEAKVISK
jgi:nitrogen fixation protein NifT